MPKVERERPGIVAACVAACIVALLACGSPASDIRETLTSVSSDGVTATGDHLRLAICGWRPPRDLRMTPEALTLKLTGDDRAGTGAASMALVTASHYRCEGHASFKYTRHVAGDRHVSYPLSELRRVGATPASILGVLTAHATPLALDTPTPTTLQPGWPALGDASAAAYHVTIPSAGRYDFYVEAHPPYDMTFTVYQSGNPVVDRFGSISTLSVVAGPADILIASSHGQSTVVTVKRHGG